MRKLIDPHVHLFDLDNGNYHWLSEDSSPKWPDKQAIRKSFNVADLFLDKPFSLEGFVHIEAGFDNDEPWREIEWLEGSIELPFKSVAYIDVTSPSFSADLEKITQYPSVVGIRYILDDDAARILSSDQVKQNFALLERQGLLFEAQISLGCIESVSALSLMMAEFPQLKVILNHCGMPEALNDAWMQGVMQLAQYPECYVKCSGWEMFDREWDVEQVKPLIDFVIRQFGLTRVMLASNFPVSELGRSYVDVWKLYFAGMNWKGFEQEMLFFENAQRIYGFDI